MVELEQELPPEIEYELELDKAQEAKAETKKAPPSEDDPIVSLKRQIEEKDRAREDAERRAREASERAHRAETDSRTRSAEQAKAAVEQAKAALQKAMGDADFDKAADLQVALADAQYEYREALRAPVARPAATDNSDPVQKWIESATPRTADYLRRHKDKLGDAKTQNKLSAAHFSAVAEGHVPDSDAYFDFVDGQVWKTPAKVEEAPKARREAVASAPVSRAGPATKSNSGPIRVKLSAGEVAAAKAMGLPNEEYARRKHLMSQPDWAGPKIDPAYS